MNIFSFVLLQPEKEKTKTLNLGAAVKPRIRPSFVKSLNLPADKIYMPARTNIAIIGGQLVVGGAERQLYLWLANLDRERLIQLCLPYTLVTAIIGKKPG